MSFQSNMHFEKIWCSISHWLLEFYKTNQTTRLSILLNEIDTIIPNQVWIAGRYPGGNLRSIKVMPR